MTATLVMLVMFVIAPLALLSFGIAMEKWANRNDEEEDEFYAI
jgi:hypothetical protein